MAKEPKDYCHLNIYLFSVNYRLLWFLVCLVLSGSLWFKEQMELHLPLSILLLEHIDYSTSNQVIYIDRNI